MAYRQLCAVTFAVLGWIAVGCGGGTGSNAAPNATDQPPPANSDQPPSNTDATTNPDVVPSNSDSPPSNAQDPAGSGGGLTALCEKVCGTLSQLASDCGGGMTKVGMEDVCGAKVNCQIPVDIPCQTEIAAAFDCVFNNLAAICSASNRDTPGAAQAEPCKDVGTAYTKCAEAHGLTDNSNGNGGSGP